MKIRLKEDSFFELKVINIGLSLVIFVLMTTEYENILSVINNIIIENEINKTLIYSLITILLTIYVLLSAYQVFKFLKMVGNYDIERYIEFNEDIVKINCADENKLLELNLSNIKQVKIKLLNNSVSKGSRLKLFVKKDNRSIFDKIFDNYYKTIVLDLKYGELDNLITELEKNCIDIYI